MKTDQSGWRATVLLSAILQAAAPFFHSITGIGMGIAERGSAVPAPEEPPGYAFAIWAVIFSLAIAFGLLQVRAGTTEERLYARIRPASAILFLLSTAWMITAQIAGNGAVLVVLIVGMLAAALTVFFRTVDLRTDTTFQRWIVAPMAGLYAGWLTLAVFLNASSAFRDAYGPLGLTPTVYAVMVLLLAGGLALYVVTKAQGSAWYAATLAWGLLAIVSSALPSNNIAVGAWALCLLAAIIVATLLARRRALNIAV